MDIIVPLTCFTQVDSAAGAGRGALIYRRNSLLSDPDLRTSLGSRKGEKDTSLISKLHMHMSSTWNEAVKIRSTVAGSQKLPRS